MKHLLVLASLLLGLSITAAASVTLTVTQPGNNQQVGSPFALTAHATTNYSITGWHVYLDGNNVYTGGATNNISANISAPAGTHQLVTRAWDTSGAYGTYTEQITVTSGGGGGGGNGLPTPPGNAIWFNNIEDRGNWSWCHDPGCAGGSGQGSYWMSQHNGNPSRDGSSAEFDNSGVWANALWWQKVGAHNNLHNMLWDFWVYLDNNSQNAAQSLEYDAFQFVGGYNYMIGSQCDYGSGTWDTWDEAGGHWIHSNIPCHKFSTNTWHHIQWYVTTNTSNHTYTYHTLVVDGQPYNVNITHNAKNLGWGDNMGVQWQLDVNASGQTYHEWMDHASLAVW
jgi:Bacterial Ig domain